MAVPLLFLAAVIEERRHAERKLRASEELFSTAFRSSPDAIAISRRSDGQRHRGERSLARSAGLRARGRSRGPNSRRWRCMWIEADHAALAALTRDVPNLRDVETGAARLSRQRAPGARLHHGRRAARRTLRHQHRARHHDAAPGGGRGPRAAPAAHASDPCRVAHRLFEHARARAQSAADGDPEQRPGGPASSRTRSTQRARRSASILAEIAEADKRAGRLIQRSAPADEKGRGRFRTRRPEPARESKRSSSSTASS